jgi:hypothetical protein
VLVRHCTQALVVVSQTGRAALVVHSVLFVQPATQRPPWHTGAVVDVQSLFVAHCAHIPVVVSQTGVPPLQSELEMHPTQRCVVVSQRDAAAFVQSVEATQPTHAPVVVSQTVATPAVVPQVTPPSPAQDA